MPFLFRQSLWDLEILEDTVYFLWAKEPVSERINPSDTYTDAR